MSFPNSNFEGNFSTYVFAKSFGHYRDLKSEDGHRVIYYAKKYKIFSYVWMLEFFVQKVKYV